MIYLSSNCMVYSQNRKSTTSDGKIGLSFSSFGNNDVFRVQSLCGDASYDGDYFYTIGINYFYIINRWLELESGLEFSKHRIVATPPFSGIENGILMPIKANTSLLSIPLVMRANFWKYFFINGGLVLEFDTSSESLIDNQSGIGAQFGVGLKYDINRLFSLYINPYTRIHSLVPFADRKYHQRIWENGVKVGITYAL